MRGIQAANVLGLITLDRKISWCSNPTPATNGDVAERLKRLLHTECQYAGSNPAITTTFLDMSDQSVYIHNTHIQKGYLVLNHTIPYGRTLTISYYGGVIPKAHMKLNMHSVRLTLSPVNEYDNRRNTWVAATIANRLKDDPRSFDCVLEPVNDIFIVTSTVGDVLRFHLYKDTLVQL